MAKIGNSILSGLVNNQIKRPNFTAGILNQGKGPVRTPEPTPVIKGAGSGGSGSSGGSAYVTGRDDYGDTDYSVLIKNAIKAGAGADEVKSLLDQRTQKAINKGYTQYAYDGTYSAAQNYIKANQTPESKYQFGSLDELWEAGGYDRVSAAEQAAIDAYIKQTVNGLESQKSGVNQSADEAARQAYISYMQSQATMPQALAASGYSGGMADSQRLALETGLQNNQKDIMLNRDNALNDIQTAIINAQLEGSIQGAQSQAQLGRDAISAFQQYMQQQNAYANQDFWNKYGYDFEGKEAATDRAFKAWQMAQSLDQKNQADKAQALASVGNFSGYAKLWGLSDEETQALVDGYAQQRQLTETQAARDLADWHAKYGDFSGLAGQGVNTDYLERSQAMEFLPKGGSGSGGSGTAGPQYVDPVELFKAARDNGLGESFIRMNYKNYGLASGQVDAAVEEYRNWLREQQGQRTDTANTSGPGLLGERAQNLKMQLGTVPGLTEENKVAMIRDALDHGGITEQEAEQLLRYIGY